MSTKTAALIMLAVAVIAFCLGVIGVMTPPANVLPDEDDGAGYLEPRDSCTHWPTSRSAKWEATH